MDYRKLLLICLMTALPLLGAEDSEVPFTIEDWQMARMRKGMGGTHSVLTVTFKLANVSGRELRSVKPEMELREAMGQKIMTLKGRMILTLKVDESVDVTLTRDLVPIFNTYFLRIAYRDGREKKTALFLGASPFDKPLAVSDDPSERRIKLMVMGYDLLTDPATRRGLLTVKLKNFGALPARRPVVRFRVYDQNRRMTGRLETALRDKRTPIDEFEEVAGSEEKAYKLYLQRVPIFDSYDLFVSHDPPRPDEVLGGEKLKGKDEVEIIIEEVELDGGSLVVHARARNGTEKPLGELEVEFRLIKHVGKKDNVGRETPHTEPKVVGTLKVETGLALAAGEDKPFTFRIEKPPASFDDYAYELAYVSDEGESVAGGAGGKTAPAPPPCRVNVNVPNAVKHPDGSVTCDVVIDSEGSGEISGDAVFKFADAGGREIGTRKYPFKVTAGKKKSLSLYFDGVGDFANFKVELQLAEQSGRKVPAQDPQPAPD